MVDDAGRYMWLTLLATKSDAAVAIKAIQEEAEVESDRKLRVLRTNNGGEFTTIEFTRHCADRGVQRHFSAPYSPQQNGVMERRNQLIVVMARTLLKQWGMPTEFWEETVSTAIFLLNRALTKSLDGMTSFEVWHGRKPAMNFRTLAVWRTLRRRDRICGSLMTRARPVS